MLALPIFLTNSIIFHQIFHPAVIDIDDTLNTIDTACFFSFALFLLARTAADIARKPHRDFNILSSVASDYSATGCSATDFPIGCYATGCYISGCMSCWNSASDYIDFSNFRTGLDNIADSFAHNYMDFEPQSEQRKFEHFNTIFLQLDLITHYTLHLFIQIFLNFLYYDPDEISELTYSKLILFSSHLLSFINLRPQNNLLSYHSWACYRINAYSHLLVMLRVFVYQSTYYNSLRSDYYKFREIFLSAVILIIICIYFISFTNMNEHENTKQNKINNFVLTHPIGENKARALRRNLLKTTCKVFQPFKEYFSKYNVYYLVEPQPTYIQKEPYQQKMSLSTPKQMEYVRGSVKQYIDQQYLQNILKTDTQDRGLVENHKSKSLIYKNILIYATDFHLKSIKLELGEYLQHQKIINFQFPQRIFEIANFEQKIIFVRCRYWIFLFDTQKCQIKKKIRLSQEVTTISTNERDKIIFITTFDQKYFRLYSWDLNKDSLNLIQSYQSYWNAHSVVTLNSRELIVGFSNKIILKDIRINQISTLIRILQVGNDRFTSLSQLCQQKNEFAVGRSKYIDSFDLRNLQSSLLSIRHFCQQSPPTCLISLIWKTPILIAYSPHQLGSALLFNIDSAKKVEHSNIYQGDMKRPYLLYDSGKFYQGLHPKSLCPIVNGDLLKLIHVDSSDGISVEVLKRRDSSLFEFIRLLPSGQKLYPQQPSKKWSENKSIEPFLKQNKNIKSDSQSSQYQQNFKETKIFLKKKNYCSLDNFRNKIFELAKMRETKKINQIQLKNTYFSESQQGQENWVQIIKYTGKSKNQSIIDEKLLDFLENSWKI